MVVCAEFQPDDAVSLLTPGRDYNHRKISGLVQFAADILPVDLGQHPVEWDQDRQKGRGGDCRFLRSCQW